MDHQGDRQGNHRNYLNGMNDHEVVHHPDEI